MPHPRLTILGGGHEIGANCYLLEWGEHSYILDAGRHPSLRATQSKPWRSFQSLPELDRLQRRPDAILISHAHQDHIGSLPVLSRLFPETPVITTKATAALIPMMLADASRISKLYDEKRHNYDPDFYWETFYEKDDLGEVGRNLQKNAVDYRQQVDLPGGLRATYLPTSHVLGSAGILLEREGYSLFYTGDFSLSKQEVHLATELPPADSVDTIIMESTYGGKAEDLDREAAHRELGEFVGARIRAGESVLIPAFALGRAQDLLGALYRHKQEGTFPASLPIHLFGLARKVTNVYQQHAQDLAPEAPDLNLLTELRPDIDGAGNHILYGPRAERHMRPHQRDQALRGRIAELLDGEPCVLLATSGMMNPGSIAWHAARVIAEQERHGILFVGYAAPSTPSGALFAAKMGESIHFGKETGEDGKRHQVSLTLRNSHISKISYSAHASRRELWQAVEEMSPKNVIVVHGDQSAREELEDGLDARYPVFLPERGECLELRNDGPDRVHNLRHTPIVILLHGASLYRRAGRALGIEDPSAEDLSAWLEKENAIKACRETALLARHRIPERARIVLLGGNSRGSRRVRSVLAVWLTRLTNHQVTGKAFPAKAGPTEIRETIADLFERYAPNSHLLACADDAVAQMQGSLTAVLLGRKLFLLNEDSRPEPMSTHSFKPDDKLLEKHAGLLEDLIFPEVDEDPRKLFPQLPDPLKDWITYDEDMRRYVWSDFGRLFRQRWRSELPARLGALEG